MHKLVGGKIDVRQYEPSRQCFAGFIVSRSCSLFCNNIFTLSRRAEHERTSKKKAQANTEI